jgi:hypothetical protein
LKENGTATGIHYDSIKAIDNEDFDTDISFGSNLLVTSHTSDGSVLGRDSYDTLSVATSLGNLDQNEEPWKSTQDWRPNWNCDTSKAAGKTVGPPPTILAKRSLSPRKGETEFCIELGRNKSRQLNLERENAHLEKFNKATEASTNFGQTPGNRFLPLPHILW